MTLLFIDDYLAEPLPIIRQAAESRFSFSFPRTLNYTQRITILLIILAFLSAVEKNARIIGLC